MSRLASLLVTVLAALPATGCYAPERMPPIESSSDPQPEGDECTGDCQVCADYCTTILLCSPEPPSAQDCVYDCFNAIDASTPECSDARREAMSCFGSLSCDELEGSCVGEYEDFTVQCDGEYDEEPMAPTQMIAG